MAFDIDKMKADGVSPHLIELAELSERNDTAAFEKIAMGIENTEIFRQFISMESDAPVWDYMYAAGLCTKDEADWFKNEENPYLFGTVCFVETEDCDAELCANISGTFKGKAYNGGHVDIELDVETGVRKIVIGEFPEDSGLDQSEISELCNKIETLDVDIIKNAINNDDCIELQ